MNLTVTVMYRWLLLTAKRYDNGDTWYEFGMGAQVQLSRNTHFYGDIERSFGGDTKKEWQVNTGIRWEF